MRRTVRPTEELYAVHSTKTDVSIIRKSATTYQFLARFLDETIEYDSKLGLCVKTCINI